MNKQDSNDVDKIFPKPLQFSDKRYIPRWEVTNRVLYSYDQHYPSQEGLSKDISCLGACLHTSENIPVDKKIKLKIFLDAKTFFEVDAKIKWKKPVAEGYSIGVIFEDVPKDIQELILTYAFEVKRDDVVSHWFKGWEGRKKI